MMGRWMRSCEDKSRSSISSGGTKQDVAQVRFTIHTLGKQHVWHCVTRVVCSVVQRCAEESLRVGCSWFPIFAHAGYPPSRLMIQSFTA